MNARSNDATTFAQATYISKCAKSLLLQTAGNFEGPQVGDTGFITLCVARQIDKGV